MLSYTKMLGSFRTLQHDHARTLSALLSAQANHSFDEARGDREFWGLVEATIGAHLANAASVGECELFYWRERNVEVDFVVRLGQRVMAIEVKSRRGVETHPGLTAFANMFKTSRKLLMRRDGIPLDTFLLEPVRQWESDEACCTDS